MNPNDSAQRSGRCTCPRCTSPLPPAGGSEPLDALEQERGRRPRRPKRPVRRRPPRIVPVGGYFGGAGGEPAAPEPGDAEPTPSDSAAPPGPAPGARSALPALEQPGGGRIRNKAVARPADLVVVAGVSGKRVPLHRVAASAWQQLVRAARRAGLAEPLLRPTSGFRSPEHQARLWKEALAKYGTPERARQWVAPPNSSPHQTGRAIDLFLGGRNSSANVGALRGLPAYRWLAANAARFGFYPYEREPWHWEYNPPGRALSAGTTAGELAHVAPAEREFPPRRREPQDLYRRVRERTPAGAGMPARVPSCPLPTQLNDSDRTALALTSYLETGTPFGCVVSRVSDPDGISLGMLQWNLRAKTLQALVRKFEQRGGRLEPHFAELLPDWRRVLALPQSGKAQIDALIEEMRRLRSQQPQRWQSALLGLCQDPLFCRLQVEDLAWRLRAAHGAVQQLGLVSLRALCLLFDIQVGDGYAAREGTRWVAGHKLHFFAQRIALRQRMLGRALSEREKLVELADEAARFAGRWSAERRARRLVIANGSGRYRGGVLDLDARFPQLDRPARSTTGARAA